MKSELHQKVAELKRLHKNRVAPGAKMPNIHILRRYMVSIALSGTEKSRTKSVEKNCKAFQY